MATHVTPISRRIRECRRSSMRRINRRPLGFLFAHQLHKLRVRFRPSVELGEAYFDWHLCIYTTSSTAACFQHLCLLALN
ncbi:hypothetical protein Scep_020710 [Stephania cephalantha]|uniref:Uncharacterized protein n=1 Tax=Stephania cephalantha TaxID=152367 RepID=A0AAP0IE89_9MAGN